MSTSNAEDVEKALQLDEKPHLSESASSDGPGDGHPSLDREEKDASNRSGFISHFVRRRSSSVTAVEQFDLGPPPDGGLTAWMQVLCGVCASALTWGLSTTFGVFQLYYVANLDHNPSTVSWIGGVQSFLIFFVGTFSGRATDAGMARSVVAFGSFLVVFGAFMTSLGTKYWEIFLAQAICIGLGAGIVFMPVLAVIGTYFKKNRAFAVGTAAAGTSVGGLTFPPVVQYLIPKIGFPWAIRCMAFMALFYAIVINVTLKPRALPKKSGPIVDWAAFKSPTYSLFGIGMYFVMWALFVGFNYIDLYSRTILGFSDIEAVHLLLIMNGVGIPSRMVITRLADRYTGPLNLMILTSTWLGIMFFVWISVTSKTGIYAFALFYGLAASSTQGMFAASSASTTDDLSKIGVRTGMIYTIAGFATLSGSSITGALVNAENGKYTGALAWAGSVVLAGSVCIVASRISKTGWVLIKRA